MIDIIRVCVDDRHTGRIISHADSGMASGINGIPRINVVITIGYIYFLTTTIITKIFAEIIYTAPRVGTGKIRRRGIVQVAVHGVPPRSIATPPV
jgi:hypothetical protein